MNIPEKSRFPERERPISKATMDQPQEEFIEDEAGTKKKSDEPVGNESKQESERRTDRRRESLR
jgi:hypothetical protein